MTDYGQVLRDRLAESLDPEMQERYKKRRADALASQQANYQGPEAAEALADGARLRALQGGLAKAANKFGSIGGDGGPKSDLPQALDAFGEADEGLFKRKQAAYGQAVQDEDSTMGAMTALGDRQAKLAGLAETEQREAGARAMDDDPNSEVSRSYQSFLSELTGGKGKFDGIPASRLKPLMAPYEGVYRVREQSAAKKSEAELRRQTAIEQKADREATRAEARAIRASERSESRANRVADQELTRAQRLEDEKRRIEEKDPGVDQSAAAMYANRIDASEKVFNDLEKSGYDRTTTGAAIGAAMPGIVQSGNARSQEVAERNFLTATLRRESGASIAPSEFAEAEKIYFPRKGDTPDVLALKKANRAAVLKGLRFGAGKPGARSLQFTSGPNETGPEAGGGNVPVFSSGSVPEAD